MAAYLVFILLFLLPLLVLPSSNFPFEMPKVIVAEAFIIVLIAYSYFKSSKNFFRLNKVFAGLIGSIFLLSLVHLVFFRTPVSFFGNVFRLQGIFLLWNLLVFGIISSKISLAKIPVRLYIISAAGLLISIFIFGVNPAGRFVGTLGEPNALAATAVFIWPFLWFSEGRFGSLRSSWVRVGSLTFAAAVLIFSKSESGLLAFLLQAGFIFLSDRLKINIKKAAALCFMIIVLSLFLPFIRGGSTFENRSEVWATAFSAGLRNPILGGGFGNIEIRLKETAFELENNLRWQYVDSAHNIFLDWWVQAGAVGLGIIGFMIFRSFRIFMKKAQMRELVCLIGVLTVMSFNPASVVTLLALWWLLGQGG